MVDEPKPYTRQDIERFIEEADADPESPAARWLATMADTTNQLAAQLEGTQTALGARIKDMAALAQLVSTYKEQLAALGIDVPGIEAIRDDRPLPSKPNKPTLRIVDD